MNWKIAGFILVIIFCTTGLATSSMPSENNNQAVTTSTPEPLTGPDLVVSQKLDEYMTALTDADRFSGAVHVAKGDIVLLSKGYGIANYEFSVPNTPQTVFPIGSNTKQLTAAAIMKLQEQGKLKLTDPVSLYIPNATNWKNIRIYQLLNHTAGIQSDGAFLITDPVNLELPDIIDRIAALPLTFEPGTNHTYSNNGYITLSYIIQQASGMPFEDYLKENLFQPLDMKSSGQDNARDVFPSRSSGYTTMNGKHIHYDLQNIHNSYGAGSIHSTTEDLFRWVHAFNTPGGILTPESTSAMVENRYGIEKTILNNQTLISHSGRNFGFISITYYITEENVSIIFLTNHDRTPLSIPSDISAIVLNKPYTLPQTIDRKAVSLTPNLNRAF